MFSHARSRKSVPKLTNLQGIDGRSQMERVFNRLELFAAIARGMLERFAYSQ